MVGAVQVGEHLLLANDGAVSLLGHQILPFVVLFGYFFVVLLVEGFTVFLDIGSECCGRKERRKNRRRY